MKRSVITVVLVCMALYMSGAELPLQGLGVHFGWAQPVLRVNDSGVKDSLNHHIQLNGMKVGVVYDASYIAGFGSSMGINYTFGMSNSQWAAKNSAFNAYPRYREIITYNEFEVFVDWQYKFTLAKETYIILYTGPTIQCGITLNRRQDIQDIDPLTGEVNIAVGQAINTYENDDVNAFKRVNVTWGLGAGFQYKRYFLRGGYDFGLFNPYKLADFDNGVHTRGRLDQWNVRVGMYIWYNE